MAQDPVCNMDIEESKAGATTAYKGETYYFCSAGCKENFEKEPEKYVKETGGHEYNHH
ncbi:MAG TPA: YHS domain-containing protein [Nitrospirae bacterium]|nr:YHS domain-containing protein [Nitrospirota bacterium]